MFYGSVFFWVMNLAKARILHTHRDSRVCSELALEEREDECREEPRVGRVPGDG